MSRIFIKRQDTQLKTDSLSFFDELSPQDLLNKLTAENAPASITGIMTNENGTVSQVLFAVQEQKLCRFPLRDNGTIFPMYQRFNDQYVLETTPLPLVSKERPTASTEELFSEVQKKELEEIVKSQLKTQLKWQIKLPIENSPLSKSQQEMLCYGTVLIAQQPFLKLLNDSLYSLNEKEKIDSLQAIIAQDPIRQRLFEKHPDTGLKAATIGVIFEAFSPDRVNQLSNALFSSKGSYHPTIGDIIHFYTSCIQQLLGENDLLESELQVQALPDDISKLPLGARHQFNREHSYNEVGLRGELALIFDFIARIINTQNNAELPLITSEIEPLLPRLFLILEDIIKAIETGDTTQLIEYNEIYNNLLALFPSDNGFSGWKNKKAQLEITKAFVILHQANALTDENCKKISAIKANGGLKDFLDILTMSYQAGVLNPNNGKQILSHRSTSLHFLKKGLIMLNKVEMLNLENATALFKSGEDTLRDISMGFEDLYKINILTPENCQMLFAHKEPQSFATALVTLHKANLLNNENRSAVTAHKNPGKLARAYVILEEAQLLNDENRSVISVHTEPCDFATVFAMLHKANKLTPTNRKAVLELAQDSSSSSLFCLWVTFRNLDESKISNPENYEKVLTHKELNHLADIVDILNSRGVLNNQNFNRILEHHDLPSLSIILNPCLRTIPIPKNLETLLARQDLASLAVNAFNQLNQAKISICSENYIAILQHQTPEKYASFLIEFEKVSNELLLPFIKKLQKHYEEIKDKCSQNEIDSASKLGQILQSIYDDKAISPEKIHQAIEGVKRVIKKEVTSRFSSNFFSERKGELEVFYNDGLNLLTDIKTKTSPVLKFNHSHGIK